MNFIKKLFIIILLLFFSINSSYIAVSAPLPPLPSIEDSKQQNKDTEITGNSKTKKTQSFFQKIKSLFGHKEKVKPKQTIIAKKEQNDTTQEESLIDFGSNQLPTLKHENLGKDGALTLPSGFQEENKQLKPDDIKMSEEKTKTEPSISAKGQEVVSEHLPEKPDDIKISEEKAKTEPNVSAKGQEVVSEHLPEKTDKDPLLVNANKDNIEKVDNNKNEMEPSTKPDINVTFLDNPPAQEPTKPVILPLVPPVAVNTNIPKELPTLKEPNIAIAPKAETQWHKQTIDKRNESKRIIKKESEKRSDNSNNKEITMDQTRFVNDEAKVLLLPNDEIVLGQLLENIKIEQMDAHSYMNLFQKFEEQEVQLDKRMVVDSFLENYDHNFHVDNKVHLSEPFYDSLDAIKKDSLFRLRALIDKYPILQKKGENNETLLHHAVMFDNYYLVKFLIMRGIDLQSINSDGETALMISENMQDVNIERLLRFSIYK